MRPFFAIGIVLLVIIIGVATAVILQIREREIASAERDLLRLDMALAEQSERSIQAVDLVLQGVIEEMRRAGVDTPEAFRAHGAGPDMFRDLRSRAAGVAQLDAINLIAADGDLINFSRYYPIPHVNVADRDYFQALRRDPGQAFFLSEPVENRGTGTTTIYLARRVSSPDGQFLGLVLGAMQAAYFEHLYDALRTEPGTTIMLRRADGIVLATHGEFRVGAKVQPRADGVHVLRPRASAERLMQIVAIRTLADYPVAVEVRQSWDAALADWRHDATAIGSGATVAAAAVIMLLLALFRQGRAYDALRDALAARDTAERARDDAEDQLRQAQKMEAVGRLTAGLAHDFSNLLTSILGSLNSPEARNLADAGLGRRLTVIRQAAERGANLTRQLLAFSRKQVLQPRRIELNAVLRDMRDLLRGTLGGTIRLNLRLQADLWPALVDAAQLEQAVLNLVINARDAMPEGGFITIETTNATLAAPDCPDGVDPGSYVALAVIDTGSGMPPDVLARAVDPFFTTKPRGSGSGLGLSQAYGFANQSGGGIRITSEAGSGTTVTLFLARASDEATPAADPSLDPAGGPAVPIAGATVLLVDDDPNVREVVAATLDEAGLIVIQAADGHEALLHLNRPDRIDLLIADYGMPGMTGIELAERARARRPGLPVMFMTGHADATALQLEKFLLQKPFRAPALLSLVAAAMRRGV